MTREFLNETQERFLKGIVAQLPIDRIAEVHLFHPMRQGGTESGVAVIATWPEKPPAPPEQELSAEAGAAAEPEVIEEPEASEEPGQHEEIGESDELGEAEEVAGLGATDAPEDEAAGEAPAAGEPKENPRFTVYTAHYRLVLKGPDRGKWELGVTAEADAPILTVETVVRGVQQRAGDVEPPHRYEGHELRALLRIPEEPQPTTAQ